MSISLNSSSDISVAKPLNLLNVNVSFVSTNLVIAISELQEAISCKVTFACLLKFTVPFQSKSHSNFVSAIFIPINESILTCDCRTEAHFCDFCKVLFSAIFLLLINITAYTLFKLYLSILSCHFLSIFIL